MSDIITQGPPEAKSEFPLVCGSGEKARPESPTLQHHDNKDGGLRLGGSSPRENLVWTWHCRDHSVNQEMKSSDLTLLPELGSVVHE